MQAQLVGFVLGLLKNAFSKKNLAASQSTGIAVGIGAVTLEQYFQVLPEEYRIPAMGLAMVLSFLFTKLEKPEV